MLQKSRNKNVKLIDRKNYCNRASVTSASINYQSPICLGLEITSIFRIILGGIRQNIITARFPHGNFKKFALCGWGERVSDAPFHNWSSAIMGRSRDIGTGIQFSRWRQLRPTRAAGPENGTFVSQSRILCMLAFKYGAVGKTRPVQTDR